MMGVGWLEMLLIGVVALIVIGPKELPGLMQKIGKTVGAVRRMGSEFQREINRSTGLDQVTDLRRSITEPLKRTSAEIAREFNTTTRTGVQPSGALKPADPRSDSVVAEIHAAAGIPVVPTPAESIKAAVRTSPRMSAPPPPPTAPIPQVAAPAAVTKPPARAKRPAPIKPAAPAAAAAPDAPAKPRPRRKATKPAAKDAEP